jgi:hypothetical protein
MQASHWQEALQVWLPPIPHACVAPGMHTPSFMQAPQSDQTPFAQVRDWVPQFPQAWLPGPAQTHVSHWQEALQVWLPPIPHACVAPGMQAPWFVQGPQSDHAPFVQVRDWVPQLPHAWVDGPEHPMHAPHWQDGVQVCKPPEPQAWPAPGAQTPWFMQDPQSDHAPFVQVRDCVPQFPQA